MIMRLKKGELTAAVDTMGAQLMTLVDGGKTEDNWQKNPRGVVLSSRGPG